MMKITTTQIVTIIIILFFIPSSSSSLSYSQENQPNNSLPPPKLNILFEQFNRTFEQFQKESNNLQFTDEQFRLLENLSKQMDKINKEIIQEMNKQKQERNEQDKQIDDEKQQPRPPDPKDNEVPTETANSDPLVFTLPEFGNKIQTVKIWPEQHESFQWKFKLNNMCDVNVDRKFVHGLVLFKDTDFDRRPSIGLELGNSPHYPYLNSYQNFDNPENDFNNNGMIDRYDTEWHKFYVWDTKTDRIYKPLQLGIVAFDLRSWQSIPDDYVGKGAYLNGILGYQHDKAYQQAVLAGWYPEKYAEHHIRAHAMNTNGVIMEDGKTHETYAAVLGYWGETSDCY